MIQPRILNYILSIEMAVDAIHCEFSRQRHGDSPVNRVKMNVSTYHDITSHDGDPPERKFARS